MSDDKHEKKSISHDKTCECSEELRKCRSEVNLEIDMLRKEVSTITEIHSGVNEMLEIFRASKGTIKVIGWLGKGIRWAALTSAAVAAAYAALKGLDK